MKKIERHRSYIVEKKIPTMPERSKYGLPEHESLIPKAELAIIDEEIKKKIKDWTADNIELKASERIALNENIRSFMCSLARTTDEDLNDKLEDIAAKDLGLDEGVRHVLRQERAFRNELKAYKSYKKWESERNEKRKALEEKYGFDTKHASHLIRLARTGVEILKDGKVNVKRHDADELLAIRQGKFSFDQIKSEAETLFKVMDFYYQKNPTNLPHKIKTEYLDRITREIVLMSLR